jgi:hypothetical protein
VLAKWRREHEQHLLLRAAEEDRAAVASLHHQPIEPELRHKEFPKLARKRIEKRTAHDSTVKRFEVKGGGSAGNFRCCSQPNATPVYHGWYS